MIEYQTYEFCKAIKCQDFIKDKCAMGNGDYFFCSAFPETFQHWLKENGYRILKEENTDVELNYAESLLSENIVKKLDAIEKLKSLWEIKRYENGKSM